jgi:xanthine dehydrogenase small subunit
MRQQLRFFLDGERCSAAGDDAFLTLADWLRQRRRLTGTKVVCAEGDCGACSVLLGRVAPDGRGGRALRYRVVDSCIVFLHQVDATHVVTVEGLARDGELHPVQRAMVEGYGSQCGYCTPGFVVTLAGLFEEADAERESSDRARGASAGHIDEPRLRRALSGNLCRCTGYVQILESARAVERGAVPRVRELFAGAQDEAAMAEELAALAAEPVEVAAGERRVYLPVDASDAAAWRAAHPGCLVVAGATDVGVLVNKERLEPKAALVLGARIPGFDSVERANGVLLLGAGATWSAVLELAKREVPELARLLELFGAPQIRNFATVGGNVVNASPIADSLPFLLVMGATLELVSPRGGRQVAIEDFLVGYKRVDLRADEVLWRVAVPLPTSGETLRLYKMSKRRDLDISSVTAAVLLGTAGERIERARVAVGGVAEKALRLRATERWLEGRRLGEETMSAAGKVAADEVAPISDVRGSAEHRRRLVENALVKVWFDTAGAQAPELQPSTSTVGRP